jgi:Tfp pilus assembly protein PilF
VRLSKRAVEASPDDPAALAKLAYLLETEKREPAIAEAAYRRACAVDPGNGLLASSAAVFLASQGRTEDAEKYHRRAAQALPANADVLGAYADFLRRHLPGQPAAARKAEALFQRALAAVPKHENNLMHYAAMLRAAGRLDEAEELYKRAVAAAPSNAIVLGNYANFLCRSRRDTRRARDMYITALRGDPGNEMVSRNYALFLRDFPEARPPAHDTTTADADPRLARPSTGDAGGGLTWRRPAKQRARSRRECAAFIPGQETARDGPGTMLLSARTRGAAQAFATARRAETRSRLSMM